MKHIGECLVVVLVGMFLSTQVEAARTTGGGNIIVCKDGKTEKIQLLDYYEGELLYEMTPTSHTETDALKIAKSIIARLKKFDKARSDRYRLAAEDFLDNTRFVNKIPLPSISDYGYIPLES